MMMKMMVMMMMDGEPLMVMILVMMMTYMKDPWRMMMITKTILKTRDRKKTSGRMGKTTQELYI